MWNDDEDEGEPTAVRERSSIAGLVQYTSEVRLRAARAAAVVHEQAAASRRARERSATRS